MASSRTTTRLDTPDIDMYDLAEVAGKISPVLVHVEKIPTVLKEAYFMLHGCEIDRDFFRVRAILAYNSTTACISTPNTVDYELRLNECTNMTLTGAPGIRLVARSTRALSG